MTPGFRVGASRPSVNLELVARYQNIPVACISDSIHRLSAGGSRLRPMGTSRMVGPAFVVRTAPGDNLMVHKALDIAPAGAVLVVDAGGDLTNAILGERMVRIAAARGLAGIIVNGAIRDYDILRIHPLPVFAAGVTHRGPYKNGPGEINYPIALDGMVIESGDLIAADEDGIVCIAYRDADEVCEAAERKARHEAENAPEQEDRGWIDKALHDLGCAMDTEYSLPHFRS
ncbi:RraA family protein [Rhizobium puerariae]|uniref:Putative 4-hydroxy-4-methyl-2-oxoglutarate aldolase n=1 Tax=Rhizobium puerariae TaxID=1585791 RepID=A0ABV6AKA4_9HYPH